MSKEVFLVFQDCPYCKPREEWGKRQTEFAKKNDINVVPTSFKAPGAQGLIVKARSHGFEAMPFFTDGKIFSMELADFVKGAKKSQTETPKEKEMTEEVETRKTARKKAKAKAQEVKEETNEVVPKE